MSPPHRPILAALYVPGDRPDRFGSATSSGADIVILDLEDAVALDRKDEARRAVVEYLSQPPPCPIVVRVNGSDTPWHRADLEALSRIVNVTAIRLPKCESADQVAAASAWSGGLPVQAVIESAIGVERAFDIAAAEQTVTVSLGEADLRSALAISDPDGLDWARDRLVIAARAAGLPAPAMSVWPDLADLDGLAASCRRGKSRGFLGRSAIHPRQIPVIVDAFRPSTDDVRRAREILAALDAAECQGQGVAVLRGRMVDEAMRHGAQQIVALAESDGMRATVTSQPDREPREVQENRKSRGDRER